MEQERMSYITETEKFEYNENYDPIGLHCLSRIYYNIAVNYDELGDKDDVMFFNKMIKYYLLSIELGDNSAYNNLGFYYEEIEDYEKMKKYYLLGIQAGDEYCMYNLGDYYEKRGDVENMKIYYFMAIEQKQDAMSMNKISLYYYISNDIDNAYKYCLMLMEKYEYNYTEIISYCKYDHLQNFIFMNTLESIPNPNSQQRELLKSIYMKCKEIIIYKNKVNLFTKLNHIVECAVCYETQINIDLKCGHCFCTTCYQRLYKKPCPICRF